MSTDRDTTRIVRSWLEEGVTALPDRVLDTVLDHLPATPQRRSWWPARRVRSMSNPIRLALAAAAVVVVALVGYRVIAPPIGPGSEPSPSPSTTTPSEPLISPSATDLADQDFDLHPGGNLAVGTYFLDSLGPLRVTFTVTDRGWVKNVVPNVLWTENSEGRVGFGEPPPYLYADPCDWNAATPLQSFGATVDDLASALADLPGLEATTTDVTVSGFTGKLIEVDAPEDQSACDSGEMRLHGDVPIEGGRHRWWSIDVAGSRLFIGAVERTRLNAALKVELQQIIDSIRIEPE